MAKLFHVSPGYAYAVAAAEQTRVTTPAGTTIAIVPEGAESVSFVAEVEEIVVHDDNAVIYKLSGTALGSTSSSETITAEFGEQLQSAEQFSTSPGLAYAIKAEDGTKLSFGDGNVVTATTDVLTFVADSDTLVAEDKQAKVQKLSGSALSRASNSIATSKGFLTTYEDQVVRSFQVTEGYSYAVSAAPGTKVLTNTGTVAAIVPEGATSVSLAAPASELIVLDQNASVYQLYSSMTTGQTGVTVTTSSSGSLRVEIVEDLPSTGEFGVIYLTAAANPAVGNKYDEWLWLGTDKGFEKLGSPFTAGGGEDDPGDGSGYALLEGDNSFTGTNQFTGTLTVRSGTYSSSGYFYPFGVAGLDETYSTVDRPEKAGIIFAGSKATAPHNGWASSAKTLAVGGPSFFRAQYRPTYDDNPAPNLTIEAIGASVFASSTELAMRTVPTVTIHGGLKVDTEGTTKEEGFVTFSVDGESSMQGLTVLHASVGGATDTTEAQRCVVWVGDKQPTHDAAVQSYGMLTIAGYDSPKKGTRALYVQGPARIETKTLDFSEGSSFTEEDSYLVTAPALELVSADIKGTPALKTTGSINIETSNPSWTALTAAGSVDIRGALRVASPIATEDDIFKQAALCVPNTVPTVMSAGKIYDLGLMESNWILSGINFTSTTLYTQTCELWLTTGNTVYTIKWPDAAIWPDAGFDGTTALIANTNYRFIVRREHTGALIIRKDYSYVATSA